MTPSDQLERVFPDWMRCFAGLVGVMCFPAMLIVAAIGSPIPSAAWGAGTILTYRVLTVVLTGAAPRRRLQQDHIVESEKSSHGKRCYEIIESTLHR